MKPGFLNAQEGKGWTMLFKRVERWCLLWTKTIYQFDLLYPEPLTWRDERGWWRPNKHIACTDLGSIPPPLRGIIPHDRFPKSYIFHDNACATGGLWWTDDLAEDFCFIHITRRDTDRMLREWVKAEGGDWCRWFIYAGVRIGSLF